MNCTKESKSEWETVNEQSSKINEDGEKKEVEESKRKKARMGQSRQWKGVIYMISIISRCKPMPTYLAFWIKIHNIN